MGQTGFPDESPSISVDVSVTLLSVLSHVFCLSPYAISFPFSFLYWDPTVVSSDLLLIRLHSCFSHNPVLRCFPYVIVLYHMTSVTPLYYDLFPYCPILYINPASYIVIR